MFSPPKISWVVKGIKCICLHFLPVFYLIQPSSKQIICFDFGKQNSVLPIVFYVPCERVNEIESKSDERSSRKDRCRRQQGRNQFDCGSPRTRRRNHRSRRRRYCHLQGLVGQSQVRSLEIVSHKCQNVF